MTLGEPHTFGRKGKPVRNIVSSPSREYLLLIYGEGRPFYSSVVTGAALFRRDSGVISEVGELPLASENVMVLDDGRCIVILKDYDRVEFVRCAPTEGGMKEEARWMEISGLSLIAPETGLLPSGQEAVTTSNDRDDGHGWSEPIYTTLRSCVDLLSGAHEEKNRNKANRRHMLLAPGEPWLSPFHGGDPAALAKWIRAAHSHWEAPLRVGPKCLLTSARVLDVASGATILGELRTTPKANRTFHDLSRDENHALSTDSKGVLELWNARSRSVVRMDFSNRSGVWCAAFLGPGEIGVGTGDGEGAVLQWCN